MSGFGGFKFGSSSSVPSSTTAPSVPSFSLTGATPTAPTPANTFSFGNTQPAGQSASTGGMFGNQPQQQPQQPQQQQPQQQQQPAATRSLFGNQQQPQQGGGQSGGGSLFSGGSSLFGSKAAPSGTGSGSGLFGGSLFGGQQQQQQQQTQSQQPQQTSLFGQSTSQQPQGGLFGQSTQQKPQNSLFGQSNQLNQQPTQSSLFGQPAQQQQPSMFGQTQSQPQQLQSSTSNSSASGLSKSTKFTDLQEQEQKEIEQMDGFFRQQKDMSVGSNIEALGRAIWQTSGDIRVANEEYSALAHGLISLESSLKQLRTKFLAEEEDLRRIAEIWETFQSVDGRPGAVRVAAHRDFPQDFFARAADGMEERVFRYKKTITQLNRVIVSLSNDTESPTPQAIAQTIQNHQNALLALAAQLERLQMRMGGLRSAYAEGYRSRTSSMRDPFEVAREEKGLAYVGA